MKMTVKEIAELFKVSMPGVRYWISKGLPCINQKVPGRKLRKIIDPEDVVTHLNLPKNFLVKSKKGFK